MGRQLWAELSAVISLLDLDFVDNPDFDFSTAVIVRCHLWSVYNDRPTCWAADASNWDRPIRPRQLPCQSTLSRRLRSAEFLDFMRQLARRLSPLPRMATIFKRMDAKTLPVAAHSSDPDAGWGRGAGQMSNGYKFHAIWAGAAMPLLWRLAPLDVSEQEMARRMLGELGTMNLAGHIVADANYDINLLFDQAAASDNRLVAPRKRPGTGLGHQHHSPYRIRCIEMFEGPTAELGGLARRMQQDRGQIERDFGNLASFGGGIQGLPAWVRRHRRVHRWLWAKLMINAARIRLLHRRKSRSCA